MDRTLEARLETFVEAPLAFALSGGGDSMALLALTADWARRRGRRILCLTVDHGLNPDSQGWSETARQAAVRAGADWRGLNWTGPKPARGLPAAARAARHRLIAEAAREAGARVVLFAHTADDVSEGEWMREAGSTLGRLREWSPSPAWPEGRGLMLLRPLLGEGRETLRAHLRSAGWSWLDDPANTDLRFLRAQARAALKTLLPEGEGGARPLAGREDEGSAGAGQGSNAPSPFRPAHRSALRASSPLPMAEGVLEVDRAIDERTLAAALVCAGGGDRLPDRSRIQTLARRLQSGERFTASLVGARLTAGDAVQITREPGEFTRRPRPPLPLRPDDPAVWDGRFEIITAETGWSVVPAAGRLAALSREDRAALDGLPPPARASAPVLIRDSENAPILARRIATVRGLVEQRLRLALDGVTHERELGNGAHGASPFHRLSSDETSVTG